MDEAPKARELTKLVFGKVPGDSDVVELGFTDAEGGSLSVVVHPDVMLPLVEAITAAHSMINKRRNNTFDAMKLTGLELCSLSSDEFIAFAVQFRNRGRMYFALSRQAAMRFGAKLIARAAPSPPAMTIPASPTKKPSKSTRVAKKKLQ